MSKPTFFIDNTFHFHFSQSTFSHKCGIENMLVLVQIWYIGYINNLVLDGRQAIKWMNGDPHLRRH